MSQTLVVRAVLPNGEEALIDCLLELQEFVNKHMDIAIPTPVYVSVMYNGARIYFAGIALTRELLPANHISDVKAYRDSLTPQTELFKKHCADALTYEDGKFTDDGYPS